GGIGWTVEIPTGIPAIRTNNHDIIPVCLLYNLRCMIYPLSKGSSIPVQQIHHRVSFFSSISIQYDYYNRNAFLHRLTVHLQGIGLTGKSRYCRNTSQ